MTIAILDPQGSLQKRPTGGRSKPANGVGPERGFLGDHRRISRQDRLGATIPNPVDPQHLLFCLPPAHLYRFLPIRQVCFCPPAPGSAFENMPVMEQAVEHGGDRGAVAQ